MTVSAEDAALSAEVARDSGGPPFQWPLMVVLGGLLVSLIVVADDHFRRGSVLFAAFVVLAFFLRLFLPERDAGWLAVRSKGDRPAVPGLPRHRPLGVRAHRPPPS